ncbi:hypothetical protein [Spiroplasma endosymbiont of Dactylopius coccus]
MKFYKVIKIYLNNVFNKFELLNVDSMTYSEQIQNKTILNTGTIYYNNKKKEFSGGGNSYPERGKINLIGDIEEIYQYQGIDTPTEFIAEENTERDYYTKLETNNLLDKKQDKLIAGDNIKIDENNKISAAGGSSVDENRIFDDEEQKKVSLHFTNDIAIAGKQTFTYIKSPYLTDKNDIPNKKYIDDEIINFSSNLKDYLYALYLKYIPRWEEVGKINTHEKEIKYDLIKNKLYKINYGWGNEKASNPVITKTFIWRGAGNVLDSNNDTQLIVRGDGVLISDNNGFLIKLYEDQRNEEKTYLLSSKTLEIKSPKIINIEKPIKINSYSLETNEIRENEWDIELKNAPSPNIPQWKEVGEVITDKNNNNQNYIKYIFKDKTHYRIYISYGDYTTKENNKNWSFKKCV